MIGETLGGYRITRKIGEGGMGEVYEAEHIFLGRRAAIKCLLRDLSNNAEATGRFFIEAKAAAMTNHPSLVDIYDQGHTEQGNAYIIMEFLEGEDLGTVIRRDTKLQLKLALSVARQVASALAAVHSKGIVHRDLKPDNLYLVKANMTPGTFRVKVLDFGIAKLTGPENKDLSVKTRTGSVLGTPSYMSPEQCRGHGKIDWRSDVYSLGCILHEMLCGKPPFTGSGYGEVLAQHIYEKPPPLRTLEQSIPPALEQLVLRTLEKNPEQRLQTMDEFGNILDSFLNSMSVMEMQGVVGPPAPYESHSSRTTAPSQGMPTAMLSAPATTPAVAEGPRNTTMRGSASEVIPGAKGKKKLLVPLALAGAAAAIIAVVAVVSGNGGGGHSPPLSLGQPAKPEPEAPPPVKPEPAKPEPTAVQPEPAKPEPTAVQPEPAKPEPTAVQPEPAKPEPTAVKPESPKPPNPTTPEPTTPPPVVAVVKPEPAKPEPPKPEPTAVKPEPPKPTTPPPVVAVVKPEPAKPEPTAAKPEPPKPPNPTTPVVAVIKPEPPKPTTPPPVVAVVKPEPAKPEPPKPTTPPAPPKPTTPVAVKPTPPPVVAPPPPPAKISVKIASEPTGAEIFRADGSRVGKTPFESQLPPATGKLAYVLKLKGFKDGKAELPADKGGQTSVKLVTEPALVAPPPPATPKPAIPPKPTGKGGKVKPVKDGVVNPFK